MAQGAVACAAVILVCALAPSAAVSADFVVWWEEGTQSQENRAVEQLIAAFEQQTGKKVELVFYSQRELVARTTAAVETGQMPDFVFSLLTWTMDIGRWASEGKLIDLAGTLGPFMAAFDKDAIRPGGLPDTSPGGRALYALPMGSTTNHLHLWTSLLEQAGFTIADIPPEWDAFWSFWCDQVQPAARRATGRDDIYGIALPMASGTIETDLEFLQFAAAYEAGYVTSDGRLEIAQPLIRDRLIQSVTTYTRLFSKGCIPPDAVDWDNSSNNKAFLSQTAVLTANVTMSIPIALRVAQPLDYYEHTATIEWPSGAYGQPLAIFAGVLEAIAFHTARGDDTVKTFVRFLIGGGWLAHWLDSAGDRLMPPFPGLLEQPFWLDAGDPHRMASALQFLTKPRDYSAFYPVLSGNWRHRRVWKEHVWARAIHRVAAEDWSPEPAVDEAIARIRRILGE